MASKINFFRNIIKSVVTSSVPSIINLIVIDPITGIIQCKKCGFSSKNSETIEKHVRRNHLVNKKRRSSEKIGKDIYKEWLG